MTVPTLEDLQRTSPVPGVGPVAGSGAMRIAMVVPPWYELPPVGYGGIEVVCAALVDALSARGHQVTVIGAGRGTGTAGRFLSTMPEPQHERVGEVIPAIVHAARVESLLREHEFDIVHDHSPAGPLLVGHRQVPTVVTVHGPVIGELGDCYREIGEGLNLVAISESQRSFRPELPWVGTVHNAIDLDEMTAEASPAGPVLWLARFCPEKGPDLAIRACRAVGLPLVLAGKCEEAREHRYLRDVIRPMMGRDVTLIVNGDRSTTRRLLRQARCLIMPIRWDEPFGMVMIEAMASGTPVVALNRGSVPEVVRSGVTGVICRDPDELPRALRRVGHLSPSDSVAHVRARFGADLMASRYEAVYRSVIARRQRTARARRAAVMS